jgi:hypothetical protein
MFIFDNVYKSIVYFVAQIVPSGITVVDGESYGVRLEDPSNQSPCIAVNTEDIQNSPIELGSIGAKVHAVLTISALSRLQRDALKSIVYSGLLTHEIPIYNSFTDFVPASGAIVDRYMSLGDYFSMRDMPNFDTNRERFYWISVVFVNLEFLGI